MDSSDLFIDSSDLFMDSSDPFSDTLSSSSEPTETPPVFLRIGHRGRFFKWSQDYKDAFLTWWLGTSWVITKAGSTSPRDSSPAERIKWNSNNRTSVAWEAFDQAADRATGLPVVVCRYCATCLTHPCIKAIGTRSMKSHLESSGCKTVKQSQLNNSDQQQLHFLPVAANPASPLTTLAFQDQILMTIISLRAPFRAVEDREWQKLALMQNSQFPLPSPSTIRRRLDDRVKTFESTALSRLPPNSKLALSLDCWSSQTHHSFMGIIAHYISSDWVLIEELIGFECMKGVHSGEALATVVNDVLTKFRLHQRVISITTDNASSNLTMLTEINSYLDDAFENNRFLDGKVQHIPCLAHVLQLALKALLGKIRLQPTNDTFIRVWEEDQQLSELDQLANVDERGIPYILAKIRKLAIFVNSSAQRKHVFKRVQMNHSTSSVLSENKTLALILDVSTRWDSTGHMLIRALRLRTTIHHFCQQDRKARVFTLSNKEWQQIEFLVDIIRPFNYFTTTVGKTRGVTIPYGLSVYDELFERLVESRRRLKGQVDKFPWVTTLIEGIDAAEMKLELYYNKMYSDLGSVYALGAMLNPSMKLNAFNPEFCWLDPRIREWKYEYEEQFRVLYRTKYWKEESSAERLQVLRDTNADPLARLLDRTRYDLGERESSATVEEGADDEVDRWFQTQTDHRAVLTVWKSIESFYPHLSLMARDILCIPLAGVGVERTFNFARDVCHYRRGNLAPETIRSLLLVYHSQIVEARANKLYSTIRSTTDVVDMTEEDLQEELNHREYEMDLRRARTDDWDRDHYIPDIEPGPSVAKRTFRIQLRKEYFDRRRSFFNRVPVAQTLSLYEQHRSEDLAKELEAVQERNRRNPGVYDGPESNEEDYNGFPGLGRSEGDKDELLELPTARSRKRRVIGVLSRASQRRS